MRFMLSFFFSVLALPCPSASAAQVGSVLHERKINEHSGGFSAPLDEQDQFGYALTRIGDLNRDGIEDLAVGALNDQEGGVYRGAVWILFLKADGSVQNQTKIGQATGREFGGEITAIGDLDGDGSSELAVTAGDPRRVVILFLNPDGTVRSQREILWSDPVFGTSPHQSHFRSGGLARIGDVDEDGIPDLAWGAPYAYGGGVHGSGALWIVRLNADGSAKLATRITNGQGGFPHVLDEGDSFGVAAQLLGDVNGDGNADLGVLDYEADGGTLGRLWILFLDKSFHVTGHQVVTGRDLDIVFPPYGYHTGFDLDLLGDLDGDGRAEIGIGCAGHGFVVAFLASDGSLRKRQLIGWGSHGSVGGLPLDTDREQLGWSLEWLGDLDGDGAPELAAGDPTDDQAGRAAGSVSVLTLDVDPIRNGSGVNPLTLTQFGDPLLGVVWKARLDCSGHARGYALLAARDRPLAGVFVPAGELLIDAVGGTSLFQLLASHAGGPVAFSMAVPNNLALVNLEVHVQGLCSGAPGARLSNALDVVIGR